MIPEQGFQPLALSLERAGYFSHPPNAGNCVLVWKCRGETWCWARTGEREGDSSKNVTDSQKRAGLARFAAFGRRLVNGSRPEKQVVVNSEGLLCDPLRNDSVDAGTTLCRHAGHPNVYVNEAFMP